MSIHSDIRNAPRALKETLERGRVDFDSVVRRTRWGDGPLFVIGDGLSYPATLVAAYGFEGLVGLPVIARDAVNFQTYAASLIRPRSVVLAISISGESGPTLDAALQARSRGATLLALTAAAESPLASAADGVLLLGLGEGYRGGLLPELCLQVGMGYVTVIAARVLKRHHPKLDELEKDYQELPQHADWVVTHLGEAARALRAELRGISSLNLVGGGCYFPAALQAAQTLGRGKSIHALAHEAVQSCGTGRSALSPGGGVLFLSGTHCRLRKEIHSSARTWQEAGLKVFAVTDANDRELSGAASLAVLLPALSEMTGAALALFFLQWLACELL